MREKTKKEICGFVIEAIRTFVNEDFINKGVVNRMKRYNHIDVAWEVRKIVDEKLSEIFKKLEKLEDLTKAKDYEYKTETKLVKKPSSKTATESIKANKNNKGVVYESQR